jgi:hypothetical protein
MNTIKIAEFQNFNLPWHLAISGDFENIDLQWTDVNFQ